MTEPKVVLVIGATSGIGLSAARLFAQRGDKLVLAARSTSRLDLIATQCLTAGAGSASVVPTDVSDSEQVTALFDKVIAEHGRLDVVVHTATVMAYGTMEELPAEIFAKVVDTAIEGTFHVARATLAIFRRQHRGNLVVVNSLVGSIAAPEMGAYVVAKWGQAGLLRVLQLETRDEKNIHISSIAPGGVNTPIYSQAANVTGRKAQPPIPIDEPEKVARAILHVVDQPRPRVQVGIANPIVILGFRLFPRIYDALVTPLLHFASLSKGETAPSDGNVLAPVDRGEAEHGPWHNKLQLPKR